LFCNCVKYCSNQSRFCSHQCFVYDFVGSNFSGVLNAVGESIGVTEPHNPRSSHIVSRNEVWIGVDFVNYTPNLVYEFSVHIKRAVFCCIIWKFLRIPSAIEYCVQCIVWGPCKCKTVFGGFLWRNHCARNGVDVNLSKTVHSWWWWNVVMNLWKCFFKEHFSLAYNIGTIWCRRVWADLVGIFGQCNKEFDWVDENFIIVALFANSQKVCKLTRINVFNYTNRWLTPRSFRVKCIEQSWNASKLSSKSSSRTSWLVITTNCMTILKCAKSLILLHLYLIFAILTGV